MGSGQDIARPEAMRSAAGNVSGLIMQASGALLAFGQSALDPASFASIGSSVSSADAELRDQQLSALSSVLALLLGVSSGVQQSADTYQEAGAAAPASDRGGGAATRQEPGIWSAPASAALASQAAQDSGAGNEPTPHRAESIIGYLAGAGVGEPGQRGPSGPLSVPAESAGDLMAWLADSPDHQAQLGVIAVYAGAARGLDDTPAGLRPGDLVCIEPGAAAADQDVIAGVIGGDGGLHNHGLLSPDFGGIAEVHVYRMIGERLRMPLPSGEPASGDAR